MRILLLERIERLGQMGDVVVVRPGYARNFLLPQGKARVASPEAIASFEQRRGRIEADNLERRQEAQALVPALEKVSPVIVRAAGDGGQLYGSVNARDIARALDEEGITIKRTQVRLEHVIKEIGIHHVRIDLHPEVAHVIALSVARSHEEAHEQFAASRQPDTEPEHTETDNTAGQEASRVPAA